ncbi:MAG TPA: peroxiredoxin-like family protein [Acidobacteriota bacterium]|nr:peroxiredoxin-like family protein [Acidobacteriota bacterium]
MELEALEEYADRFRQQGATVVAVSPMLPKYSRQMVKKHDLSFDVLSDEGSGYAGKLGLVFELPADLREIYREFDIDLPRFNGDESWTLPMPARYVVDGDGRIRWSDVHPDYTQRSEPEETLQALLRLKD